MRKKQKLYKERYEEYLECTKHLDNSERMVCLKQAIWNHILKKGNPRKRS